VFRTIEKRLSLCDFGVSAVLLGVGENALEGAGIAVRSERLADVLVGPGDAVEEFGQFVAVVVAVSNDDVAALNHCAVHELHLTLLELLEDGIIVK
jgi:hypothetical protein